MKPSRHHIAAGATVVALGLFATVALASVGSDDPVQGARPAAATPAATATADVRREDRREDRRQDRATAAATPAATPDDHGGRRDESGHGGRGRDHAEDGGTVELEHHGDDDGGHHGGGDSSGHGGGGHDD